MFLVFFDFFGLIIDNFYNNPRILIDRCVFLEINHSFLEIYYSLQEINTHLLEID